MSDFYSDTLAIGFSITQLLAQSGNYQIVSTEFDFIRWILGFGGNVKVHKPDELRHKIIQLSTESINVYQDV